MLAILLIVIIAVASGGKPKSAKGPSPTSPGNKNPAGCAMSPSAYPDQQSTDCVALPNNTASLAGTVVTATWSRATNALGDPRVCAAVSIKNNNSSTISYNELYWKLQSPSGAVSDTDFLAAGGLGSGDIVAGGTATGNVCFDDPGQSGTYVGIYKPDPFNATRGIWLFPLG
jgi:hypothetical protein